MLDWTRIGLLRDDFGPDGFEEIVEMFAEETRGVVLSLDRSDDLAGQLHFVKGGADNMGFAALATLCKRGEQALKQGAPVDTDAIARCFEASFTELRSAQTRNSESVASSVMSR